VNPRKSRGDLDFFNCNYNCNPLFIRKPKLNIQTQTHTNHKISYSFKSVHIYIHSFTSLWVCVCVCIYIKGNSLLYTLANHICELLRFDWRSIVKVPCTLNISNRNTTLETENMEYILSC
jgi:hypothetical protein